VGKRLESKVLSRKAAKAVLERAKERQLMAQRAKVQQAGDFPAQLQQQEAVARQPENIETKRLRDQEADAKVGWKIMRLREAKRMRHQEAKAQWLREKEATAEAKRQQKRSGCNCLRQERSGMKLMFGWRCSQSFDGALARFLCRRGRLRTSI
jgi:hypothetical protein